MDVTRDDPAVRLRRCVAADAEVLARLRLSMLAESPTAYAVDAASVAERPDSYWAERAAASGAAETAVAVFGCAGDVEVAMGAAHLEGKVVYPGAMWVHPRFRSAGFGAAILAELEAWGASRGAIVAVLGVAEHNMRAAALYLRCGYALNGEHSPLRDGGIELHMAKELTT